MSYYHLDTRTAAQKTAGISLPVLRTHLAWNQYKGDLPNEYNRSFPEDSA